MIYAILTLTALVGLTYILFRLFLGVDLVEEIRDLLEKDKKVQEYRHDSVMIVRSTISKAIYSIETRLEGAVASEVHFAHAEAAIAEKEALLLFTDEEKQRVLDCLKELIHTCGPEGQIISNEELKKIKYRAKQNLKWIDKIIDEL